METNNIKKEKYICPAIEVIMMDTERPYAVFSSSLGNPGISNSKQSDMYIDDDILSSTSSLSQTSKWGDE